MTATEMFDYFSTNFNMTDDEVVALMGAHTLGGARRNQSGYSGPWIAGGTRAFNNRYYSIMLDTNAVPLWDNEV